MRISDRWRLSVEWSFHPTGRILWQYESLSAGLWKSSLALWCVMVRGECSRPSNFPSNDMAIDQSDAVIPPEHGTESLQSSDHADNAQQIPSFKRSVCHAQSTGRDRWSNQRYQCPPAIRECVQWSFVLCPMKPHQIEPIGNGLFLAGIHRTDTFKSIFYHTNQYRSFLCHPNYSRHAENK